MNKPVLDLKGVRHVFKQGRTKLEVLAGIDLCVREGEIVALVGPSGSGKSTLLHIAGLLEAPGGGSVTICGEDAHAMNDDARTKARRENIGFVYQYHHLLPEFSALENIVIPQVIGGTGRRAAKKRAGELLHWLGLNERATHRPGRLSGGEQQRVAVGRALMTQPQVLMLDEPTAGVSPIVMDELFDRILEIKKTGVAILMVEQNARQALNIADKGYVLVTGENKFTDTGAALLANPEVRRSFLGG